MCAKLPNWPTLLEAQVGWSLVHHVARVGDHGRLLWLLSIGAEVDPVDRVGVTPLSLASAKVDVSLSRAIPEALCVCLFLLQREK